MVADFLAREVVAIYPQIEHDGYPPRELFRKPDDIGVMGLNMPEQFGGGAADYVYNVVLQEETARAGVMLGALRTHLDVILPYLPE
jgi:acyl-CoA dehydrogenase